MTTGAVATVRGQRSTADLGRTLMHEHVFAVSAALANDRPELAFPDGRAAAIDAAVARLRQVKDAGIDTIVDVTVFGHDRDIPSLVEINERVDLNIVVATGFYTEDLPSKTFEIRQGLARARGGNFYVDVFVADIVDGIGSTGVHAGIIKCVTGPDGVTRGSKGLLRASAIAARETGVPITTHSDPHTRGGLEQLELFAAEGVDLTRVIIGHSGDTTDTDYLKAVMDTGATIASDRFGYDLPGAASTEERVAVIADLCGQGYADRIVVSHDAMLHTDWLDADYVAQHPNWTPTFIPTEVVPTLREAGVSEADLNQILVTTPARLLAAVTKEHRERT
ncbi:phosphotriesterase-related protein [Mycolicibacterium sp. S2-37]|uniref:phosphotriesterase family protein n=1 Tax=Mycolicibacterium sp. S2-37 TaxID=2810297 RepID=UPI001A9411DB|nr:phosphotriesterase-related protein [Mycolicibacterium sp. S2-37]MBO0679056.1 phosphotriesterase-related protein [Mycolicibacterium sp. S2-37]